MARRHRNESRAASQNEGADPEVGGEGSGVQEDETKREYFVVTEGAIIGDKKHSEAEQDEEVGEHFGVVEMTESEARRHQDQGVGLKLREAE